LHINLVEHLNSEIGLKTISDVETAKTWLRSSFLYQRMQRNPKFYCLKSEGDNETRSHQENINDIIRDSIEQLKKSELIHHVENGNDVGKLSSTKYGEIMSKVCIILYSINSDTDIFIIRLALHSSSNCEHVLQIYFISMMFMPFQMDILLAIPKQASLRDVVSHKE
jgi:replicative superfamily II helicase